VKRKQRWRDLSTSQRAAIIGFAGAALTLALFAERDLARRPADQIRGSKRRWAVIIAMNWLLGPLAYFRFGVRR